MKKLFILCLFLIGALSVFSQTKKTVVVYYMYSDGSGNDYRITPGKLAYEPMTKERSSSGNYSGGDPKTVSIDEKTFKQLAKLFEDAMLAKNQHDENREMTTGLVMKKKGDKTIKQAILKPGAEYITKIETTLSQLLYP